MRTYGTTTQAAPVATCALPTFYGVFRVYGKNARAAVEAVRPQAVALLAELSAARAERDKLRAALSGLVGAESVEELRAMEATMRLMPVPAADKAATLDAIHALLAE